MPATPANTRNTDPAVAAAERRAEIERYTPRLLTIAAAWSWRFVAVAGAFAIIWWLGAELSQVVVPVLVAIMITALLWPVNRWLVEKKWPSWAGAAASLLTAMLILLALIALVGTQIAGQWDMLVSNAVTGFQSLIHWLGTGPLQISEQQMTSWTGQALDAVKNSREQIAGAVASAGSKIGAFGAGTMTALFAAFFFLKDGHKFGRSMGNMLPAFAREEVVPAVTNGWHSLVVYMKSAVTVAAIDGIGAGLGALILGSQMWLAILVLTFICSLIPIIGALIAGTIATVVVLVTLGPIKALIMLAIFVAVMSIEANVLQPLILGNAAEIHPLIVLLGITVGSIVAGIAGALFAIPVVAFVSGLLRKPTPEVESAADDAPADQDTTALVAGESEA